MAERDSQKKTDFLKSKYMILLGFIMLLLGIGAFNSWRNDLDFRIVKPRDLPTKYEAGTWVFALSYENDSEENYAEIYAPDTMDEEGNLGKVFTRVGLPVTADRTSVEVTFEEYTTDVRMRVVKNEGNCTVTEISYRNTKKYNDAILIYLIWLLAVGVIVYLIRRWKDNSEKLAVFLGLILVTVVAMLPYMNSFLQEAHDLEFHLLRIEGVYQGLKEGVFPARINMVQSNGYGYISPIMYPQLMIYIPAAFRLLGMSLLNSYKLLVWIGTILTVIISWYSFKKILDSSYGGLVGSALYTLGLYRLTNVYCRAAVGEYLAAAFLPLALYGMYEIVVGNHKKWIWACLGITLIFQQHILTTEIFLAFTFFMCLGQVKHMLKEPVRILALLKAAGLTILLNLGTIIPLLQYMREEFFVFIGKPFLPDMVVYLSEVFATFVKMEGAQILRGTTKGEMPLSIGGILVAVVILFGVYCYKNKEEIGKIQKGEELRKLGVNFVVTGSIAIVMTMWFFPWTMLAKVEIIGRLVRSLQFLSRLLIVPALLFCVVAGILVVYLIKKYPDQKRTIVMLSVFLAIGSCLYPLESIIQLNSYDCKEAVAAVNYTDDLYLYDGDTNEDIVNMGKRIWTSQDVKAVCKNLSRKEGKVKCELVIESTGEQGYVELPLYYYPHYTVELGGQKLNVEKGEKGVLRAYLNEDSTSGELIAYFDVPVLWKIGDIVSLISVIVVLVYLAMLMRRSKMVVERA